MAKTVKIQCNGAGQHVNELGLHKILEQQVLYRSIDEQSQDIPERVTLRCCVCAEGRIVITRPMLEEMLGADYA